MSRLDKLYIAATGMITPAGMNTEMTAASVNAGVNLYQNSSFMNRRQYPMKIAKVPDDALVQLKPELNPSRLSGQEKRMISMAATAVEQIFENFRPSRPIPIFIAVTESIPGKESSIDESFIDKLTKQTMIGFDAKNSCIDKRGRAASLQLLEQIFQCLKNEENNYALLLGVDSYLDADLLSVLDEDNRVLTEVASDGFAPGEGAAAILLLSQRVVHKSPNTLASITRPGLGEETGHRFSEDPVLGDGLSAATSSALANNKNERIDKIYSSFNGESFHNKEFGVAVMRNSSSISLEFEHEHPADSFGDIGAAFGPTLIALASYQVTNASSPCLVLCTSEQELRGAVCVSALK